MRLLGCPCRKSHQGAAVARCLGRCAVSDGEACDAPFTLTLLGHLGALRAHRREDRRHRFENIYNCRGQADGRIGGSGVRRQRSQQLLLRCFEYKVGSPRGSTAPWSTWCRRHRCGTTCSSSPHSTVAVRPAPRSFFVGDARWFMWSLCLALSLPVTQTLKMPTKEAELCWQSLFGLLVRVWVVYYR